MNKNIEALKAAWDATEAATSKNHVERPRSAAEMIESLGGDELLRSFIKMTVALSRDAGRNL